MSFHLAHCREGGCRSSSPDVCGELHLDPTGSWWLQALLLALAHHPPSGCLIHLHVGGGEGRGRGGGGGGGGEVR